MPIKETIEELATIEKELHHYLFEHLKNFQDILFFTSYDEDESKHYFILDNNLLSFIVNHDYESLTDNADGNLINTNPLETIKSSILIQFIEKKQVKTIEEVKTIFLNYSDRYGSPTRVTAAVDLIDSLYQRHLLSSTLPDDNNNKKLKI